MPIVFQPAKLLSRIIRTNTFLGQTGQNLLSETVALKSENQQKLLENGGAIRTIASTSIRTADKAGGLLGFLGSQLGKFGSWLFAEMVRVTFGGLAWTAGAVWGFLVNTAQTFWTFDWNASDKQLLAQLQNQDIQLASLWGGVLGSGLGWMGAIALGAGVATQLPVIGGALLAKQIIFEAGKEAVDEVGTQLTAAISQTLRIYRNRAFLGLYVGFRRLVKSLPYDKVKAVFGEGVAKAVLVNWGKEGGPRWSIGGQVENWVEGIKNPATEAFVEELLEEAWDSFVEAGFVIANQFDEAYQQAKAANRQQWGEERTLVIKPDRDANEELVFANMPQNLLIPAAQTLINTHRLVDNRDVGQIVGQAAPDFVRASPLDLRLEIQLFSNKIPPFYTEGATRVQVKIPNPKRSAIDWQKIKNACGGVNGYLWGRFLANATMSSGRSIKAWGASKKEAEDRVEAFASLTEDEILTINTTEENKTGVRLINPGLYKDSVRVYPAYVTILNRDKQRAADRGRPTKTGNYRDRDTRLELWVDQKPFEWDEVVRDLLKDYSL